MTKSIEKIILGAALAFSTFGCATTREYLHRSIENTIVDRSVVSCQNLRPNDKPIVPENVQHLITNINDTLEYIELRKTYDPIASEIVTHINNKELDRADSMVKELASMLEQDPNPWTKDYLEKIKNFSYEILEVADVSENKTYIETDYEDLFCVSILYFCGGFLLTGFEACCIPLEIAQGQAPFHATKTMLAIPYTEKTKTEIIGQVYNRKRISPYTGEIEILEEGIPIEKSPTSVENSNAEN